jgi:hypothetical protein
LETGSMANIEWFDDLTVGMTFLSDLGPKFICQACGPRGADIRPLFDHARMGTGAG